jgi:RNA polymerase sigma-70 factor, ECF subfamily
MHMQSIQIETSFSSADFLERLRNQDHGAITAVVKRYTRHVYRAALGLGFSPEAADEVTQNVWGTFFEVLPGFKGNSHVRTFLFGILYNKAKQYRRGQASVTDTPIDEAFENRFDPESGQWTRPPMNPQKFLEAAETAGVVQACLDDLPASQRMAFVMRELEGASTEEICNVLGVSVTNLGVLLHRARNRLRESVEQAAAAERV